MRTRLRRFSLVIPCLKPTSEYFNSSVCRSSTCPLYSTGRYYSEVTEKTRRMMEGGMPRKNRDLKKLYTFLEHRNELKPKKKKYDGQDHKDSKLQVLLTNSDKLLDLAHRELALHIELHRTSPGSNPRLAGIQILTLGKFIKQFVILRHQRELYVRKQSGPGKLVLTANEKQFFSQIQTILDFQTGPRTGIIQSQLERLLSLIGLESKGKT